MSVVEIKISQCTNEDIFAEDVISDCGAILVTKDTSVNSYVKSRLIGLGISTVKVYSSLPEAALKAMERYNNFEKVYKDTVISIKQLINDLSSGKRLDYDRAVGVTEAIYNTINESPYIINCIEEVSRTDEYTHTHCVNTAFYSMLIGKWLDLSESDIKKVIQAGLLHDVGKTRIPLAILNKKDRLTNEEFDLIKSHTIYGYDILNEVKGMDTEVKRAALLHHERIDGSGYPFHASSDCIGIYARIVAVADVFDAMTSDRVYKKGVTPFEAFQMFKSTGIGIFDPIILNRFTKNIAAYYTGAKVMLSDGHEGKIAYMPPHDILHPVVQKGTDYIDLSNKEDLKIQVMMGL